MTTKKGVDWRIVVAGIFCVTVVELFAMYNGMNGTMLGIYMVLIGAAIGVTVPNPLKK